MQILISCHSQCLNRLLAKKRLNTLAGILEYQPSTTLKCAILFSLSLSPHILGVFQVQVLESSTSPWFQKRTLLMLLLQLGSPLALHLKVVIWHMPTQKHGNIFHTSLPFIGQWIYSSRLGREIFIPVSKTTPPPSRHTHTHTPAAIIVSACSRYNCTLSLLGRKSLSVVFEPV